MTKHRTFPTTSDTCDQEHSHPSIWQNLQNGDTVVSPNSLPVTSNGPDHAQEHVNKIHRRKHAISGLTTDPQGLLKYCLSSPALARLTGETESMLNISDPDLKKHHQHSQSRTAKHEKPVIHLMDVVMVSNTIPLSPPENDDTSEMKLIKLVTK